MATFSQFRIISSKNPRTRPFRSMSTMALNLKNLVRRRFRRRSRSSKPYSYSPLNSDAGEIRLATLVPGSFTDEIHVTLNPTIFTRERVPRFEALSYAWGSLDDPVEIYVDSPGAASCVLKVTQDLAVALRHLRYEDRARVHWIDAICVDQHNPVERSRQVERMADIYRMSERVLVWLGPEGGNSGSALRLLETLASHVELDWDTLTIKPASDEEHNQHWGDERQVLPYDAEEQRYLDDLLSRSWFERLWIWPEVCLANERAIIMCGSVSILWTHFQNAMLCLGIKELIPTEITHRITQRIFGVVRLCSARESSDLLILLSNTNLCKYTDARDRIYALLSMLGDFEKKIGIRPDYTKTTGQVYQDVVLRYLECFHKLHILSHCKMQNTPSKHSMPTWVPDWSAVKEVIDNSRFRGSGGSLSEAQYIGDGVLNVTGTYVSAVKSVHNIDLVHGTVKELLGVIRNLASFAMTDTNSPYLAGGTLLEAFCRTICGSFNEDWLPVQTAAVGFEEAKVIVNTICGPERLSPFTLGQAFSETPEILKICLSRIRSTLSQRCFYMTEEGYIGLGPTSTVLGDEIAVLLGCETPLILRIVHSMKRCVVGRSYTQGFMNAEALLGPMPNNFRQVRRYDEETRTEWFCWANDQTGDLEIEDPRLGELPAGWSRKHHGKEHLCSWFVNEATGEGLGRIEDPRLRPCALRARGIDLKVFELV